MAVLAKLAASATGTVCGAEQYSFAAEFVTFSMGAWSELAAFVITCSRGRQVPGWISQASICTRTAAFWHRSDDRHGRLSCSGPMVSPWTAHVAFTLQAVHLKRPTASCHQELMQSLLDLRLRAESGRKSTTFSSALLDTIVSIPQVVRARLQQRMARRAIRYRSGLDVLRITLRREGVGGLYKGLLPTVLRVMPQVGYQF